MIGPTYIAEVAPPAYRGRLASFQQAAIVLGITVSQLVNWGIAQRAGGESQSSLGPLEAWQWMLWPRRPGRSSTVCSPAASPSRRAS